jgi:hypothetical protein
MTRHPVSAVLWRVGLPLLAGGIVLTATAARAWPPWAMVFAVAGASGAMSWWRTRTHASADVCDVMPVYAMQRPIRAVPASGVVEGAPYAVSLTTHSQLALIMSPTELVGPEALHVPLTGHNACLTVTATGAHAVTVRDISATVTARMPFAGPIALTMAVQRMPKLVLSADLLESILRSVAGYRPLSPPDVVILLDHAPADFRTRGETGARPRFEVRPGSSAGLVFAPVTATREIVHWRLSAVLECNGRTDIAYWDLALTAESATASHSPEGSHAVAVHDLYPDHWAPGHSAQDCDPNGVQDRFWTVAAHTAADGTGFLTRPVRPGPDPEAPRAAELRRQGDACAASGQIESAAIAYRQAATAGSGPAAYELGNLCRTGGDPVEALNWYRQAAGRRIFPAFNDAGAMAYQLGDLGQAEQWFRRAMDEGDWTAALNLAALLGRRGDVRQAKVILTVASRAKVPHAPQRLDSLLAEQGRTHAA